MNRGSDDGDVSLASPHDRPFRAAATDHTREAVLATCVGSVTSRAIDTACMGFKDGERPVRSDQRQAAANHLTPTRHGTP